MSTNALDQALFTAAVQAMPQDKLSVLRRAAANDFATSGFPTQRIEDWKYTNLAQATELSNQWLKRFSGQAPETANVASWPDIAELKETIDANWLVIRNGVADPEMLQALSDALGDEVTIIPLSSITSEADLAFSDPLSAFNVALLHDGLQIRVKRGARPDKPLVILHADNSHEGKSDELLSQTRIVINCQPESSLQMFEYAISRGEQQFANAVVQVDLKEGAKLDFVRLQNRCSSHIGINRMTSVLHANAELNHCAFDFGNGMGRNDVSVNLVGANAQAHLSGLYLTDNDQHIDNHLCVTHTIGPAFSSQNYRGILSGQSRAVFNGKAEVLAGADGTDASQSNHNLLLSERCEIDTKPELEIYADDVKCNHGATVGQLDEMAIFYLQTRGISRRDATRMLTQSFAASILNDVTIDACKDLVSDALLNRLNQLLGSTAE